MNVPANQAAPLLDLPHLRPVSGSDKNHSIDQAYDLNVNNRHNHFLLSLAHRSRMTTSTAMGTPR